MTRRPEDEEEHLPPDDEEEEEKKDIENAEEAEPKGPPREGDKP
jgi:hypothetical protein